MRSAVLKRLISIGMISSILAGCVGCSALNPGESQIEKMEDLNSITCMVWDRGNFTSDVTADDNKLTEWIRENSKKDIGVDVHFEAVTRSSSDTDIQKMVEEGTAPDIIFTYSTAVFGALAKHGRIANIESAYKEYCQDIESTIGDIQYMGQYNEQRVAVMKRRGFQSPRHMAYIRKDWCDALGMSVPTTKEELFKYLYAVKEKNPGNVDGVIPWGMGGNAYSEKYYQKFIESYITKLSERTAYIYSEKFGVFAEGAINGVKELNILYNDGIISLDFPIDTDDSKFRNDVMNGKVGFFIDDCSIPFDYIGELKKNVESAELVPVQCFDLTDGAHVNITEPLYGMFIMVPSASKEKLPAILKYLNWLSDPKTAVNIAYTPEYEKTSAGAPMASTADEFLSKGYPPNPDDYNIVNGYFDFCKDKTELVSTWAETYPWESKEWFEHYYDVCTQEQMVYPATSSILEAEALYQSDLEDMIVKEVYNLICCPEEDFDKERKRSYEILNENGLDELLNERAGFFDSGELRFGE